MGNPRGGSKIPRHKHDKTFSAIVKRQAVAVTDNSTNFNNERLVIMAIEDHLADIDFRTRAERQKQIVPDLCEWYKDLLATQAEHYSERIQGQLTMLSSVLWYLLPEKDYKQLTKLK